jgi:hypothetical protein
VPINKTLARQQFGHDNPIGLTVRGVLDGVGPGRVIGVVHDVRPAGVDARIRPEIYVDFRQTASEVADMPVLFTLRTVTDPAAVAARANAADPARFAADSRERRDHEPLCPTRSRSRGSTP